MVETRFLLWLTILLVTILLYPIVRKAMYWRLTSVDRSYYRSLIVVSVITIIIQLAYNLASLGETEYIFIQAIVLLFWLNSGFNLGYINVDGLAIDISRFKIDVLRKLGKAYRAGEIEEIDIGYKFSITTPYTLKFDVTAVQSTPSNFVISPAPSNLRIVKVLVLLAFYIMASAVVADKETVNFPVVNEPVNAVFFTMVTISLVVLFVYIETVLSMRLATEFSTYYKKILQKTALAGINYTAEDTVEPTSIKSKAKNLLATRETNVIKAKQEEMSNKIKSVFGYTEDDKNLDPTIVERMRLMKSVKRVLITTPSWKTVALKEIAKKVKGKVDEVELIISGFIEIKEVSGVYDVWEKQYYGSGRANWSQTQEITRDLEGSISSIKIYPDGSTEVILSGDKDED